MTFANETQFRRQADETLEALMEAIEDELGEEVEDIDLMDGVLSIGLTDGRVFLLNQQMANRQLWLSSPVSGAWHYGWDGTAWVATRDGSRLVPRLARELAAVTGVAFELDFTTE